MLVVLTGFLLAGLAQAQERDIEVKVVSDPMRDLLIVIIVTVLVLYVIIRLLAIRRKRKREEEEAKASEYDKAERLRAEKAKLERMMEAAKKSYYKRELSEAEAKKLMFEYKQRIIEIGEELKVLE